MPLKQEKENSLTAPNLDNWRVPFLDINVYCHDWTDHFMVEGEEREEKRDRKKQREELR